MNLRQKYAHMQAAYVYSSLSYCIRRQVGCVIVCNNNIISIGYNGTPPGSDNKCEDKYGLTMNNVIHAEINALSKLDFSVPPNSILFCTTCPCLHCAQQIIESGIKHVVYDQQKNTNSGLQLLQDHDILCEQLSL